MGYEDIKSILEYSKQQDIKERLASCNKYLNEMEMLSVVPEFLHVDTSDWDTSTNIDISMG